MSHLDHLAPVVADMLASNIVVGPALVSVGIGGLAPETYRMIHQEAEQLVYQFWPKPISMPGSDVPVPTSVTLTALGETISSTAAYLSHLKLGYLSIDEPMVRVAVRLIEKFTNTHNPADVHALNLVVVGYDNGQLLRHEGRVRVSDFISGRLHRPWIHYTLADELAYVLSCDAAFEQSIDGERYVSLTDAANARFVVTRQFLRETGFLRRRADLMRLSQFSQFEEYDDVVNTMMNFPDHRELLLRRCGIQPGMRVLELGCGTGELTLTAGLWKLADPDGQIIATDPSTGMLARANRKLAASGVSNVKFVSAAAESLPFEDSSFDAVVGIGFLHFTDIPAAIAEIHRVGKPGSLLATSYPLSFPQSNGFFTDWFAPLLANADNAQAKRDILPDRGTVPAIVDAGRFADIRFEDLEVISDYRQPETLVKFYVQVANIIGDALAELPWKAQQDMISHLIARGYDIRETYGADNLIQIHPAQFLQARIVKG